MSMTEDLNALCAVCGKPAGSHAGSVPHRCPNPGWKTEDHFSQWYLDTVWASMIYTVECEPAEYTYERLRREDLDNQEDPQYCDQPRLPTAEETYESLC